ncbi:uncharacterized protein LOC62_05G007700 [Vanrija pseudolonga]|uniref:Uncharacterized protein n=1 Tax=Vanrija pseudolonga TaxID=143232 RepID=A0AAF1BPJ9_9TREE|nr:hypothetical protein LOC62_05G007700 [Vanrija pseudolonga]
MTEHTPPASLTPTCLTDSIITIHNLQRLGYIEVPFPGSAATSIKRETVRAMTLDHRYRAKVGIEYIDKEFERELPWDKPRTPIVPESPDDQICAFLHECFLQPDRFQTLSIFREVLMRTQEIMRDRIAWLDQLDQAPPSALPCSEKQELRAVDTHKTG